MSDVSTTSRQVRLLPQYFSANDRSPQTTIGCMCVCVCVRQCTNHPLETHTHTHTHTHTQWIHLNKMQIFWILMKETGCILSLISYKQNSKNNKFSNATFLRFLACVTKCFTFSKNFYLFLWNTSKLHTYLAWEMWYTRHENQETSLHYSKKISASFGCFWKPWLVGSICNIYGNNNIVNGLNLGVSVICLAWSSRWR